MHGGFPTTTAGWILFALTLVSSCATACMGTNLILSGLGRRRYRRGDIVLTYVFATTLLIASALLIHVDPGV